MSLAAPYQELYYVADGLTTSFAFGQSFTALNEIDVKCIIYFEDGTNCVPTFDVNTTTGYIKIITLTKPDGTILTVPPVGSIVRVFRKTPEAQNITASQLQNYTAKQLERIFDSVVAMIQETSFLARRKTVRLTETQRDISIEKLTEEKDQALVYWDFGSHQLRVTSYTQGDIPRIELLAQEALETSQEAKQIAENALEISEQANQKSDAAVQASENALDVANQANQKSDTALQVSAEALETAQRADEKSDTALEKAQHAEDYVLNLHSDRFVFTISSQQTTLTFGTSLENKEIDLYWNGQYITQNGNWTVNRNTITMLFEPEAGDKVAVVLNAIRQSVNQADLDEHNADPNAHSGLISALDNRITYVNGRVTSLDNSIGGRINTAVDEHNEDLNAHSELIAAINGNISAVDNRVTVVNNRIDTADIDCGTLS